VEGNPVVRGSGEFCLVGPDVVSHEPPETLDEKLRVCVPLNSAEKSENFILSH
jgi:hypothetical protein